MMTRIHLTRAQRDLIAVAALVVILVLVFLLLGSLLGDRVVQIR
jgi:hypothetical protein